MDVAIIPCGSIKGTLAVTDVRVSLRTDWTCERCWAMYRRQCREEGI